ncbi:cupin domain-containing protein [Nocardioides sp. T2.26MG-1]|uniref:cupin domain-containing protein n=1 Tax=Nocardioides sp. T2.26MG-1 TaxID=3041166 RepID=UPI0024778B30|nr:cupin domain-containing protein [Nocardioides sp. T2.26MG-1]CAI9403197.1 hypothetical protein HIDPHFAB_00969 [Nocardioides sp. T2.26MG-1]
MTAPTSRRLLSPGVLAADLGPDRTLPLDTLGDAEVGIWSMDPGTERDTEVDEVFVVLAGRGTVAFEDGEVVELGPGVAVRLHAGERTTWTVGEALRKVYVALSCGYGHPMARYDRDLQAAVDATSVAKDAHTTTDLLAYLREQLASREINTSDEDWLRRTVAAIEADPNYMVADEPSDFDPERRPA